MERNFQMLGVIYQNTRDLRRYNQLQHKEVTAVYADDKNDPPGRELIIHTPSASLQYLEPPGLILILCHTLFYRYGQLA